MLALVIVEVKSSLHLLELAAMVELVSQMPFLVLESLLVLGS